MYFIYTTLLKFKLKLIKKHETRQNNVKNEHQRQNKCPPHNSKNKFCTKAGCHGDQFRPGSQPPAPSG